MFASIIGGGLALVGGIMGSSATEDAASTQADAARDAANINKQASAESNANTMAMYQQNRADTAPWREAGATALGTLNTGTAPGGDFNKNFSFGMNDFNADPGYQFSLDQATKALQKNAAANGTLNSGGFDKALSEYTLGAASNEYSNVYNRAYTQFNTDSSNRFNRLATIAGLGSGANSLTTGAGSNAASTIAGTNASSAAGQANAAYGVGNANSAGIMGSNNSIVNGLGSAMNQYTRNQALNGTNYQGGNSTQANPSMGYDNLGLANTSSGMAQENQALYATYGN